MVKKAMRTSLDEVSSVTLHGHDEGVKEVYATLRTHPLFKLQVVDAYIHLMVQNAVREGRSAVHLPVAVMERIMSGKSTRSTKEVSTT